MVTVLREDNGQALFRNASVDNNLTYKTRTDDNESANYNMSQAQSSDKVRRRAESNSVVMFFEPSKGKKGISDSFLMSKLFRVYRFVLRRSFEFF